MPVLNRFIYCFILFAIALLGTVVPVFAQSSSASSESATLSDPQNSSEGLTLLECYSLALKQSETVAIQKEIIREAEGRFWQSLSTALPKISYEIEETRQDGSGATNFTLRKIP